MERHSHAYAMADHAHWPSVLQARHSHLHSQHHARSRQHENESDGPDASEEHGPVKVVAAIVRVVEVVDQTGAPVSPAGPTAVSTPSSPEKSTSMPTATVAPLPSVTRVSNHASSSNASTLAKSSTRLSNASVSTSIRISSLSSVASSNLSTTLSSHRWSPSSSSRFSTSTTSTVVGMVGPVAGGAGAPGSTSAPATASTSQPVGGSGLTPTQQSQVIAGVVGGVAGIAVISLLLLLLVKTKKHWAGGMRLLGPAKGGSSMHRRLPSDSSPGGRVRSGGIASKSSTLNMVSTARASPASCQGNPSPSSSGSASGERGFYRVSGRKLTSVLRSGGDGYSEPGTCRSLSGRASDASDILYHDSAGFLDEMLPAQPLQLGSPMRPVSGVMIMRSGPARTPVGEQAPFSPYFDDPPSPDPSRALRSPPGASEARSLVVSGSPDGSRASSRVSVSRFTEHLT